MWDLRWKDCVCVCFCLCVCGRKRERGIKVREYAACIKCMMFLGENRTMRCVCVCLCACVCVCVCVCVFTDCQWMSDVSTHAYVIKGLLESQYLILSFVSGHNQPTLPLLFSLSPHANIKDPRKHLTTKDTSS